MTTQTTLSSMEAFCTLSSAARRGPGGSIVWLGTTQMAVLSPGHGCSQRSTSHASAWPSAVHESSTWYLGVGRSPVR